MRDEQKKQQVALLKESVPKWNEWREEKGIDDVFLRAEDFTGCNLAGANLSHLDLECCNFTDADLSGCNFTDADLSGCDFSGAILKKAIFFRARVWGAALYDAAYLLAADWRGAELGPKQQDLLAAVFRSSWDDAE
ncbi:MAG: pentapeptide repeat-containing protein [Patescibacteria group bacterium]|nr:pentapeptide repeat-containing protein [Patescibacteria group bacterium]